MNTRTESNTMQDLTTQQLEDRLIVVETENATIKAKLDMVRAERIITGEWADPDWYRRAVTRQRFTGLEHQQLTREIAKRKREAKAAHRASIERAFVGAAKTVLTQATFDQLMGLATAEVDRG